MLQKRKLASTAKEFYDIAEFLRKRGWCQGVLCDASGAHCIVGAAVAMGINLINSRFLLAFRRNTGSRVSVWNDAPGRTKEEVIDKLEEIAWSLMDETD